MVLISFMFIFTLSNVATRKTKVIHVTHLVPILDVGALENP